MTRYERRLPVYVLLDCSESMVGEPFAAVKDGLASLMMDLKGDPMALETAYVSVITFASTAQQVLPLTEVMKLTPPNLPMGSGTALGAALSLLERCTDTEVAKTTSQQKGDWKPVCFILTDGEPTDSWERAADSIRTNVAGKRTNVIAVAVGPDADPAKLRRITETVLVMPRVAPGAFKHFFKWVSASVSTASQRMAAAGETGLALPHLPEGVEMAPPPPPPPPPGQPPALPGPGRHVFLHARCVKSRASTSSGIHVPRPTTRRLARREAVRCTAAGSFLAPDFEPGEAGNPAGPKTDTDQLIGQVGCPSCRDPQWALCSCGRIHCCPAYQDQLQLTCPWCGKTNTYGRGSFDVSRGRG